MRDINYINSWSKMLTPETVGMLTIIHEFKGEQNLFIEAHVDALTELMEVATVSYTHLDVYKRQLLRRRDFQVA